MDYKTEWKSAALDEDLVEALERMDLHQCLQEKGVDLLLLVQKERENDPPGAMFHAIAFRTGENEYLCGKKGCGKKGTAEHIRQHLHKEDHLGIRLFWCQYCPSKFFRKADLTRHKRSCLLVQDSTAAVHPAVGHNPDNKSKKDPKYDPYALDLRRKHSGVPASAAHIPPPCDLLSGLPPYPQQNSDFTGISQQGQPLIPVPAPWQSHAAGVDCPPTGVHDLLSKSLLSYLLIITSHRSQPWLAEQPNFLDYPYAPFDYQNGMIAQTFSAPGPSKELYRCSLDIDHSRIDVGYWQHGSPQSAAAAADTTDVAEKRNASEAELGSQVRPYSKAGYLGVCSKKSGFPSGTMCLVMLTALIVALVLFWLGIVFAYHILSLDKQGWRPALLGLLDNVTV
ncbi:hypothetical protein CPB86DRAFT_600348 [Serendipita vermifera]|nr:hypothetical protein CPB86DRAFT_600348 [Serendipita vermifera]